MKIGDKVICQFFNWPEGKFYGEWFYGEIIDVNWNRPERRKWDQDPMPYLIKREFLPDIWMASKEVSLRENDNA